MARGWHGRKVDSMTNNNLAPFGAALEQACRTDACPPPQLFVEVEHLPPGERAALNAHVAVCPACAAERALAAGFAETDEVAGSSTADVQMLVERLQLMSDDIVAGGTAPTAKPAPGARGRVREWGALAASLIAVSIVLLQLKGGPPPLPEAPVVSGTLRSASLLAPQPSGDLSQWPAHFKWDAVPGAADYAVAVFGVDHAVLWDAAVSGTRLETSQLRAGGLRSRVRYYLHVDALDADGAVIASSRIIFRIDETP